MHVIFSSVLFLGVCGMMCFVGDPCRIFEWRWFLCGSHVGFWCGDWDGDLAVCGEWLWLYLWMDVGMIDGSFGYGLIGRLDMAFLWGFRENLGDDFCMMLCVWSCFFRVWFDWFPWTLVAWGVMISFVVVVMWDLSDMILWVCGVYMCACGALCLMYVFIFWFLSWFFFDFRSLSLCPEPRLC